MEKQPVVSRNQGGKIASHAVPAFSIHVKQPQCSGRADQRNILSNHDSCGLMSSLTSSVKSKVKTCLPVDCTSGGITVTLDNNTMWNEFYHRNTEMILTKQGRRMFPYCRYWIKGLESNLKYILIMDISPVDNFCYKWTGCSWESCGKAEPHILGRVFIHSESPSTGQYWMHHPVSFYKLKLTINTLDQEGHIILHSMHRYLPRLHVVPADKATEVIQLTGPDVHTFTFPQTEFFAVTAYQNIQITQLKIDYNPFAKGFIKDGLRRTSQYETNQHGRSGHEGSPGNNRCPSSSEVDILDPGQQDLNASYRSQKMCNTGLERESFSSDSNEYDEPELKQETSKFPIANACASDSCVKSLLISDEGINISIKEELVDDCDCVPTVNVERIQVKKEETNKKTEDFSCSEDDPLLEKQLKKHSAVGRKEVEIKSYKRSHNSPLDVAKPKMLKLDNGTMPTADCEVTKNNVKASAHQAILSSCRTDKSFLRHSNLMPEDVVSPLTIVEARIKTLISENKDMPWENIPIYSSHSIKEKTANFKLVSSVADKFIIGEKKPNAAKNPVLSNDIESNPSAVLSGPCRREGPWKLKLSEVKQPLKNSRKSVMTNHCVPLGPRCDHPGFMFELEDVDGVLFVSFESKEGLNSHTVDASGKTEEPQNTQAALQITCDSGYRERLSLLETKLLEDMKFFRHRQVIHPSLREVGLKLGSVDPTISIDLKYLGVQLPLSSSKDRVFGNSQRTSPGSIDSGLSFTSKTGKTDDFRKIKGWQEKFHNASKLEGSILEGSLKNHPAFCSDKLDEYLESEGKLMEASMGFSASFTSHPMVCQFSSERGNYDQAQNSILKKKCSITPPASYSFKSLSLPSTFRKRRRNINGTQAASRGSIRSSNSAVPSPLLSKAKHSFQDLKDKVSQPNSKMANTVNVLMMPDLDENVQGGQRTVSQSKQNSHEAKTQMKLMALEDSALQDGKPQTYITEERANVSLTTLFTSQVQVKLMDLEDYASCEGKPRTYISEERADVSLSTLLTAQALLNNKHVCKIIKRQTALCSNNFCQLGCVCDSLALEKSKPTVSRNTKCTFDCPKRKMALIKGTSIQKHLCGILACCSCRKEGWKLEEMSKWKRRNDDFCEAELEQSSINFAMWVKEEEADIKPVYIPTSSATKSTKHVMLPQSEDILPFNKLNPSYSGVKLEQVKTPNSNSVDHNCELPEEPHGTENDSGGQKNATNSIIPHIVSAMRENGKEKIVFDAVHLEERKSYMEETETMDFKVTMSDSKPEELLVAQPESNGEGITYNRNAISRIAGKNTDMVKQLTSNVPVFQLDTVLADHTYFLKKTDEAEKNVKFSEDTSEDISQLQSELSNSMPKDAAQAVGRSRPNHIEEERCRRKEIKELFKKLQATLQFHTLPRVATRILLEKAFEEIQGLTDQAEKLMVQKKSLICKQDILIRKVSVLSDKTQEVILKKIQCISANQKAVEAQKQHQQKKKQPVKPVETVETSRPYVPKSSFSEVKEVALSKRKEKPMILSKTGCHATENEDSFLMPRIVNVMSLATEEDTALNLDVNGNPYVSCVIDSLASEPSLPNMCQEINFQYVEKVGASYGKERDTTGATQHFVGKKETSFPQVVKDPTLKGSPESFATKLCIGELAQSQAKEKPIDKGGTRQQSKDFSFQELQVKEHKDLRIEMELQKVACAVQEAAPDGSDLMDVENDDTDETLISLLNEIAFLNQPLDDDASGVSKLPNSLSSCFSPGGTESHREPAAADGSPFQFGSLGGSFKDLSLIPESGGSITPLFLHLEDDSIADHDGTLRQPSSKTGVLKLLGSEVKDPNLDVSAINTGGSGKHMGLISKSTHVLPPILKMKATLQHGKVDTEWKPMPKLAPFGLKPANVPLDSGGQITKVMPLLAPMHAKVSSIGLNTSQSVTNQEQE